MLLTGATGYLGEEVVKKLGKARILVRDLNGASNLKKCRCELVEGDVTNPASLARAVKGAGVVIHGAAVIRGSRSDYAKVNVEGTKNLVNAAKKANVKHFIFLSSILAAYPNPTPYGRSKLAAEKIVRKSGIPYTILRISIVYKPNDGKTIGKLSDIVRRLPVIPLIGSGNNRIQPVFIEDVASAIAKSAKRKPKNRNYYLAGPQISYKNVIKIIAAEHKLRRILLPTPVFAVKAAVLLLSIVSRNSQLNANQIDSITSNQFFDYSPAAEDLGFRPISFSEGLKRRQS